MRKITKSEYTKAQRIVAAYEKQQQAGKYQFLYWLEGEDHNLDAMKIKWIDAKVIDDACEKFLLQKSSDVVRVDYEVMFEYDYIDITNKKGFEYLI